MQITVACFPHSFSPAFAPSQGRPTTQIKQRCANRATDASRSRARIFGVIISSLPIFNAAATPCHSSFDHVKPTGTATTEGVMAAGKRKVQTYGKQAHRRLRPARAMSFFPSNYDTSQQPSHPPPRPPRSQKEATMASEPSDDNIANVSAFTGMDRGTAVRYLKVGHARRSVVLMRVY